jgi:hypothetical protein
VGQLSPGVNSVPSHVALRYSARPRFLRSAGCKPDERLAEAIEVVEARRHQNGRWPMNHLHADRLGFAMETDIGRASRSNTLRALRVLKWYNVQEEKRADHSERSFLLRIMSVYRCTLPVCTHIPTRVYSWVERMAAACVVHVARPLCVARRRDLSRNAR